MKKLVSDTIDALRTQPLALALVVINIMFLAAGGYTLKRVGDAVISERDARNTLITRLIESCRS